MQHQNKSHGVKCSATQAVFGRPVKVIPAPDDLKARQGKSGEVCQRQCSARRVRAVRCLEWQGKAGAARVGLARLGPAGTGDATLARLGEQVPPIDFLAGWSAAIRGLNNRSKRKLCHGYLATLTRPRRS